MVVVGIKRYGRTQKLAELRVLERKHALEIQADWSAIESAKEVYGEQGRQSRAPNKPSKPATTRLEKLLALLAKVRQSPMRKVHEAVMNLGRDAETAPHAPTQLIQVLQAVASAHIQLFDETRKEPFPYETAYPLLAEAIMLADGASMIRSAADVRLQQAHVLLVRASEFTADRTREVQALCDWVLSTASEAVTPEQKARAKVLRSRAERNVSKEELRSIIAAMGGVKQAFGGAASHWFECANGHPYFIDSCGGAMQQATCPECHAPIGGLGHRLDDQNRHADALFRTAEVPVPPVAPTGYVHQP
jgi:hypothetical protein